MPPRSTAGLRGLVGVLPSPTSMVSAAVTELPFWICTVQDAKLAPGSTVISPNALSAGRSARRHGSTSGDGLASATYPTCVGRPGIAALVGGAAGAVVGGGISVRGQAATAAPMPTPSPASTTSTSAPSATRRPRLRCGATGSGVGRVTVSWTSVVRRWGR